MKVLKVWITATEALECDMERVLCHKEEVKEDDKRRLHILQDCKGRNPISYDL